MSRARARVTYDEVTRMLKAIRDLGLPIGRIDFNDGALSVVIGGESGDKPQEPDRPEGQVVRLIREPKL